MKRRQALLFAGLIVVALALAFPLQDVVRSVVIGPLLYLGWIFGVVYRSVPQFWLWAVLLFVVFLVMLDPFLEDRPPVRPRRRRAEKQRGAVESLADSVKKANRGIYSRWLIANRLGKIMRDWLAYRERMDKRWHANDLAGMDGQAPEAVRRYLDAGLNGSFADYPRPRWSFLRRRVPTPLDIDPNDALDYLESHMEAESGRYSS